MSDLKPMPFNAGRARNARLNQAIKHATALIECLAALSGETKRTVVDNKDAWQDGRNALEQLVQCFHEASAYNNALANHLRAIRPLTATMGLCAESETSSEI